MPSIEDIQVNIQNKTIKSDSSIFLETQMLILTNVVLENTTLIKNLHSSFILLTKLYKPLNRLKVERLNTRQCYIAADKCTKSNIQHYRQKFRYLFVI